ncbi:hypothetical protein JHK86_008338 [Glycine max]|nr:hypothetical protein JHK86_008338 [Glycine max]
MGASNYEEARLKDETVKVVVVLKKVKSLPKPVLNHEHMKGGGNVRMDGITAKSKDKVGTSLAIPIFDQRLDSTWQMMS